MDVFTRVKRSMIMAKIKSKNTLPERLLFTELHRRGVRFHRHYKLVGRPDIAFRRENLAVFVDGDFWHGHNWKVLHQVPPKGFWRKKISRNMKRDRIVNKDLAALGWKVVRIWEHQVEKNQSRCADRIVKALSSRSVRAEHLTRPIF